MNKIYCCADLHGVYKAWQRIKDMLDDTDILYFLGDAADRGTQGWQIIKEMLSDPRVIYLKGNHEDMLADAMINRIDAKSLLYRNGGKFTLYDWQNEGADLSWWSKLDYLPEYKEIDIAGKHFILSHAGCNPNQKFPDYLWDRRHIRYDWPQGKEFENIFIIHGHTPVPYMPQFENKDIRALHYANGHKINIDLGGFFTNYFCLLDLNTMEEIIIDLNEEI